MDKFKIYVIRIFCLIWVFFVLFTGLEIGFKGYDGFESFFVTWGIFFVGALLGYPLFRKARINE